MKKEIVFNFLDAPPGAGKTTAIVKHVIEKTQERTIQDNNKRFLIVTPYRDEVRDICAVTPCIQPVGTKTQEIKKLIRQEKDICCTHALFLLFDRETLRLLKDSPKDYELIIDEELSVISPITDRARVYSSDKDLPKRIIIFALKDFSLACEANLLQKTEDNLLKWNYNHDYSKDKEKSLFDEIEKRTHLYDLFEDDKSAVIQVMKRETWESFSSVTFCSYRMKESYLAYYCQLQNIKINWLHLNNSQVITEGYLDVKPEGLDRIEIFTTDSPNNVNQRNYELLHDASYSKSWYQKNIDLKTGWLSERARALRNEFRNWRNRAMPKGQRNKYYWTSYKGFEDSLTDLHLSKKKWIPCNQKATDNYASCIAVGYLINRFPNVSLDHFLKRRGIKVKQKEIALSEFIQFLWRSNIRIKDSKEKIFAFVPSKQLYDSFLDWRGY